MLTYPNLNRPFDIYPDASNKYAMGIRRCNIKIHTDHQNLTQKDTMHANLHEQRTQIFLNQEFARTFAHIAGEDNTGADSLSCLPMYNQTPLTALNHVFAICHIDGDTNSDFPLDMTQIRIAQANDNVLQHIIHSGCNAADIANIVIDSNDVTTFNGKVWVPQALQQQIVAWYHKNLQHAGVTQMVNTIGQTFAWKGLCTMVEKHVTSCNSCQRNKQSNKKQYGKLPLIPAMHNRNPWEKIQVNCCGPWKI